MYGRCNRPMARQLARKMGNALLLKSCPQGHEDEEQEEQEAGKPNPAGRAQHLRCSVLRPLAVAPASWLRRKMRGTAARISSAGHV